MSFILDALRKSDAERQRAAPPGLTDVRYAARPARRNAWLPILVLVLAANVAFMGVWIYRSQGAAPEPGSPATAPGQAGAVLPAPVTVPLPAPAPAADIRPLAREVEYGEPLMEPELDDEFPGSQATVPVLAEGPDIGPGSRGRAAPAAVAEGPPAAPARPSRIVAGNDLPTAEQLMGSGGLNTPVLNLDLHVYSSKPADRFVVINSRKYREGGQLSEGPTVESITGDGVVLAMQGRRFTLSSK